MEAVAGDITPTPASPEPEAPPQPSPVPPPAGGGTGITVDEPIDSAEMELFADIDEDLFDVSEEQNPPAETPPVVPTPVEPIVEPVAPPVIAEPVPPAPVVIQPEPVVPPAAVVPIPPQPEAPVAPVAATPTPEPPVTAPPAPEVPAYDYAAERGKAASELEKRYALSKEDADAMISEPETVLPKLASQMYLDIYEQVMRQMQGMLPQAVQHIQQATTAGQKDESDFYDQWGALAPHKDTVMRIGTVYRQMNPTAPKDQFIREVGLQSMIALRLPLEGTPGMPPAPVAPTPPVVVAPPVPPQAGAVTPAAPSSRGGNIFADLADEWEESDKL
jgi:hypothetical protein